MGKIFELDAGGMEHLLSTAIVGRIAYAAPDVDGGRPGIVPIAYGYDGTAVYLVGPAGRKVQVMRSQPLVTFEVDTAEAEDRWQSCVAEGEYEELTDPALREYGLSVIYPENRPSLPETHVVFRINLTSKSGRFELPDDEAAEYERTLDL